MAAYTAVEGAVYVFRVAAGGDYIADGYVARAGEDGDYGKVTGVGEGVGEFRGCACVVLLYGAVADG